jgi:hypothetical protein
LIAVLTDPAVGGTFLTWSLHYLSGHENYFSAKNKSHCDLPADPLTAINSHNFVPNQPNTVDEFNKIFDALISQPTDTFHTIYFHNFIHKTESVDADLERSINQLVDHAKKIIVLSNSKNSMLYHAAYKLRSGDTYLWQEPGELVTDPDTIFNDFVEYFFKESLIKWNTLQLTAPWDRREFIALNFNFKKSLQIKPNINASIGCYNLDTMDLFNTFDSTVKNLFEYLDIPIAAHRWQGWVEVYNRWRQHHYNRLQFVWYFDTIIDSILRGEDFDLTRFQLDLVQEATIQNALIYNHNFNLKTWQLEKFTNTQQLHNLLEPNFHELSKQL